MEQFCHPENSLVPLLSQSSTSTRNKHYSDIFCCRLALPILELRRNEIMQLYSFVSVFFLHSATLFFFFLHLRLSGVCKLVLKEAKSKYFKACQSQGLWQHAHNWVRLCFKKTLLAMAGGWSAGIICWPIWSFVPFCWVIIVHMWIYHSLFYQFSYWWAPWLFPVLCYHE